MPDPHDLARFVVAQAPVMAAVQAELRAGQKRSHWMWFVFPQLRGLGSSPTARHYGIAGRAEAEAFLAHPVLGPRLIECTELVNAVSGRSLHQVFGSPDDMKFHSCVTLFDALAPDTPAFRNARTRFFNGKPDPRTLQLLDQGD